LYILNYILDGLLLSDYICTGTFVPAHETEKQLIAGSAPSICNLKIAGLMFFSDNKESNRTRTPPQPSKEMNFFFIY